MKALKIHFSDIFWPIFGGICFSIFDLFLRFNLKISTLNNFLNAGDLPAGF